MIKVFWDVMPCSLVIRHQRRVIRENSPLLWSFQLQYIVILFDSLLHQLRMITESANYNESYVRIFKMYAVQYG